MSVLLAWLNSASQGVIPTARLASAHEKHPSVFNRRVLVAKVPAEQLSGMQGVNPTCLYVLRAWGGQVLVHQTPAPNLLELTALR